MNCETFSGRVDELVDGLVAADEAAVLRAHAASCDACAAEERRAIAFVALLGGEGGRAAADAADRELAALAVAAAPVAPGPRRGVLRRFLAPASVAAAALTAAFLAGRGAGPAGGEVAAVATGDLVLERGELRPLGPGRTVLADERTRLFVYDGYPEPGERVRIDEGSALFQIARGRPLTVETEAGVAEVQGTLFQVRRTQDAAVRVSVVSGTVVFRPARGGHAPILRDGAVLDVSADGRQRLTTRAEIDDLEVRAGMQGLMLEALRGDLQKREEEIAALRARLSGDGTDLVEPGVSSGAHWNEIGAALRRLFTLTGRTDDPAFLEAMAPLHAHATELTELTGSSDDSEWPWHPAVMSRGAEGFIRAFAPDGDPADHTRAVSALRAVAIGYSLDAPPGALPAESRAARLRMLRGTIVVIRDHLGMAAAADIALAVQASRAGAPIWPEADAESARRHTLDDLTRTLELTDAQRATATVHVDRWIAARRHAQGAILREWGQEAGREFLFAPRLTAARAPQADDTVLVADSLRRIDAKLALVAPRIELERFVVAMLNPEQAERPMRTLRGLGETFIWTIPPDAAGVPR